MLYFICLLALLLIIQFLYFNKRIRKAESALHLVENKIKSLGIFSYLRAKDLYLTKNPFRKRYIIDQQLIHRVHMSNSVQQMGMVAQSKGEIEKDVFENILRKQVEESEAHGELLGHFYEEYKKMAFIIGGEQSLKDLYPKEVLEHDALLNKIELYKNRLKFINSYIDSFASTKLTYCKGRGLPYNRIFSYRIMQNFSFVLSMFSAPTARIYLHKTWLEKADLAERSDASGTDFKLMQQTAFLFTPAELVAMDEVEFKDSFCKHIAAILFVDQMRYMRANDQTIGSQDGSLLDYITRNVRADNDIFLNEFLKPTALLNDCFGERCEIS